MSAPTVYLAGPILGLGHEEANEWRHAVSFKLAQAGIKGVSPLRCEPIVGPVYQPQYGDPLFGTARAIASKNLFDTKRCDMVLALLPRPQPGRHQSYGALMEIAWAHALGKPVLLVSDDPDITAHPVVTACASWLLEDLDAAVEVLIGVLSAYTGGANG